MAELENVCALVELVDDELAAVSGGAGGNLWAKLRGALSVPFGNVGAIAGEVGKAAAQLASDPSSNWTPVT